MFVTFEINNLVTRGNMGLRSPLAKVRVGSSRQGQGIEC